MEGKFEGIAVLISDVDGALDGSNDGSRTVSPFNTDICP